MSPASTAGGSQTARRAGTNYRYRTINAQSEVDETLFGAPHRLEAAARMRADRQQPDDPPVETARKQAPPPKKQFVRHVTKDLIRDIMLVSNILLHRALGKNRVSE